MHHCTFIVRSHEGQPDRLYYPDHYGIADKGDHNSGLKKDSAMNKSKGNVLDFVTIAITILAMSVVVMAYLECTGLMMKKLEISQISRKYILKMETEGYLNVQNEASLLQELQEAGMSAIDIAGTTLQPVTYGEAVYLKIRGRISGRVIGTPDEMWSKGFFARQFTVEEQRMSTAKN